MSKGSGTTRNGRRRTDTKGDWRTLGGYMSRLSNEQIALLGQLKLNDISDLYSRIRAARIREADGSASELESKIAALPSPISFATKSERKKIDALIDTFHLNDEEAIKLSGSSILKRLDAAGFVNSIAEPIHKIVPGKGVPMYSIDGNGESRLRVEVHYGGVSIERTFYREGDGSLTVHHDLFTVPKALQGKGISKATFREMYKHYKSAGVKNIMVYANIDVGGYTWARYGFMAKGKSSALYAINSNAANAGEVKKQIKDFYMTHSSATPYPMKLIADRPDGRELLKGGDWPGVLDLSNPQQRKDFEDYLYDRHKKK